MLNKISILAFLIVSACCQCLGQASSYEAKQLIEAPNPQIISAIDANILTTKQVAEKTTFNFDPNNDLILLPVIYKGRQLLFVLDTGVSLSLFDIGFAKELGQLKKNAGVITAGNKTVMQVYNAPEAYLGPYNLKDYGDVLCADLRMISSATGTQISGLIGMSFLKKHCVQIDSDNSTVTIYNNPPEKTDNLGRQFSLKFDMGIPCLYGSIDNNQVLFTLDTGGNIDVQLQSNEFDNLVKNKKLTTAESLYETPTGKVKASMARLDRFGFGESEYKDLLLFEGNSDLLGFLFLTRHIVTIDFPNGKIYFKKGRNFSRVYQSDMSGLHLLKIEDKVTIFSVDKGSSAQTAGIKSQDVIVNVQGKDAGQYKIWQIRDILSSGDGKKINLTIKRGDQTLDVPVVLKKKI